MTPSELRTRRLAIGLSQQKLAEALGVQRLAVIRWENGDRGIPPYLALALETLERRANL